MNMENKTQNNVENAIDQVKETTELFKRILVGTISNADDMRKPNQNDQSEEVLSLKEKASIAEFKKGKDIDGRPYYELDNFEFTNEGIEAIESGLKEKDPKFELTRISDDNKIGSAEKMQEKTGETNIYELNLGNKSIRIRRIAA